MQRTMQFPTCFVALPHVSSATLRYWPLLFIMYINDLASKFPCYLFADDCIIEQYGETAVSAVNKTNIIIP